MPRPVEQYVPLRSAEAQPPLAKIIKRSQELPGEHLFQYTDDDGNEHPITSTDVNAYIREISGEDFTAKDFRTWGGTTLALMQLAGFDPCESETEATNNSAHPPPPESSSGDPRASRDLGDACKQASLPR